MRWWFWSKAVQWPHLGTLLLCSSSPNSRGSHNAGHTTRLLRRHNYESNDHLALRIIQINDVYALHNFPHLLTLIADQKRNVVQDLAQTDGDSDQHATSSSSTTTTIAQTIVVCAGDFLSPSLLSSLDAGASMVDTLNQVGVTHVCLGNHEADVGLAALGQRIQQSTFCWVNSNMPDLVPNMVQAVRGNDSDEIKEQLQAKVVPYDVIELGKNQPRKKVALLGLLTPDPSLYHADESFGGATIQPVVIAARDACRHIQQHHNDNIDLIIPLTHQSLAQDVVFAQAFCNDDDDEEEPPIYFPIICGGHDHEIYDQTVAGKSRIIKTGMDAAHAAIIDITWSDGTVQSKPHIQVEMIPTNTYAANVDLVRRIQAHEKVLEKLKRANLFRIADWMDHNNKLFDNQNNNGIQFEATADCAFSTRNNRLGPSTGTSALATMLRMSMRVQAAILNAGAVRANKVYHSDEFFTWSDLKSEMPYASKMTVVEIPGGVLEETIAASRPSTQQSSTKDASGKLLHCCSNIHFDDSTGRIVSIQGKPFEPHQKYLVALPAMLLAGLDNHKPLLEWVDANHIPVDAYTDKAIPAKMLIVQVFAASIWLQLGSFDEIDRNQDGNLCRDEVKAKVAEVYGNADVADLVVNSIFSVADMNNDNTITPLEMMIVQFCATDLMDHVCTKEELAVMKQVASNVLGLDPSHDDVKRMVRRIRDTVDSLDGDMDGLINRIEVMNAVGDFDARESDLLS